MENRLTHFDESGHAIMVNVGDKTITKRVAIARGDIHVNREVFDAIKNGTSKKGDVLGVARVAGIMGTKNTSSLIPMCHTLLITKARVDFILDEKKKIVTAECEARVDGKTGVEMEALTGVNIALLTIYDMCKAIDKTMTINNVRLVKKSGGKSGDFINE